MNELDQLPEEDDEDGDGEPILPNNLGMSMPYETAAARRSYAVAVALDALLSGIPVETGDRVFVLQSTGPVYDGPTMSILVNTPLGVMAAAAEVTVNQLLFMLAHISETEVLRLKSELAVVALEEQESLALTDWPPSWDEGEQN